MARRRENPEDLQADISELTDKFRAMKKRYMKVVKENARLRKELNKYEEAIDTERVSKEVEEATYILEKSICQECHEGTVEEFKFGTKTLLICTKCKCRQVEK